MTIFSMFFNVIVLVVLVRVLISTDKPFFCSGIHATAAFCLGLLFNYPASTVIMGTAITFCLSSLYFCLLDRLDGSIFWWLIMLGGILSGMLRIFAEFSMAGGA